MTKPPNNKATQKQSQPILATSILGEIWLSKLTANIHMCVCVYSTRKGVGGMLCFRYLILSSGFSVCKFTIVFLNQLLFYVHEIYLKRDESD